MTSEVAAYVFGLSVIPTPPLMRDLPDLEPFDAVHECAHGLLESDPFPCTVCLGERLGVAA